MNQIVRAIVAYLAGIVGTTGYFLHKSGFGLGFMAALISIALFLVAAGDIFGERNASR